VPNQFILESVTHKLESLCGLIVGLLRSIWKHIFECAACVFSDFTCYFLLFWKIGGGFRTESALNENKVWSVQLVFQLYHM
jgi:hypothetical protein